MKKLCLLAVVLCACGGDDGGNAEPELIPGGGIHDPGIDGKVHVYVIDEDTDAPLSGATVRVGTIEGQTDATGLFTAEGDLSGKQTVIAKATNYAASVWVGANGANITIPMTKATTQTTTPAQAELSGTVAGWDTMALPAANHLSAAIVVYSQAKRVGDDEGNDLPPPAPNSNICVQPPAPAPRSPCNWRLNARAGTIAVGAALADLDTKGTQTEDDDELTITGFALKQPITVADGADQSGLSLDPLPSGSTTTASVTFGTPPAGLTQVAGVVGVDLGDTGVLRLSQVMPTRTSVVVPSLSAISGAAGYEFLGFASEPVTDGTAGQSIVLRRGITSASGIAAGEWLNPPGGLASDRASVSFNASAGSFGTIIEINTGTGNRAMSVIVLDGTTSVALPVEFAPLPSGGLSVTASAIDAGSDFRVDNFEVETLIDSVQRLAAETIELN